MSDNNVRVAVRCRPFNTKEKNANEVSCVKITKEHVTIINPAGTGEEYNFGFDYIYNVDCKQDDVWTNIGVPILDKALNGIIIIHHYHHHYHHHHHHHINSSLL